MNVLKQYILYNNDIPVARFSEEFTLIKEYHADVPELLPMQISRTSADGFASWIRERSIDLNTLQHRNMVNELHGSRDKITLALQTHMFSISDTFTCFEEGEFQPRASICTPGDQNFVSRYILVSSDTSLRNLKIATPNISTDGSFPKTWVYENNDWWLYKLQSEAATRSEVEISRVLRDCGWETAEYDYVPDTFEKVKTRNFVGTDEFFEPYDSFRYRFSNPSDDDLTVYHNLASLGEEYEQAWQRIMIADAFFENTDRHMRNFGAIRSAKTGAVLRLAPNFDNNQAYRANPAGKYSPAMLEGFMRNADGAMRSELECLTKVCLKNPYLLEAAQAAQRIL